MPRPIWFIYRWAMVGLEVEAEAQGDGANGAFLALHAVDGLVVEHLSSGGGVLVEGLLGVVDGVGAHAVVVDTGAEVASEVGAEAEHPREGGAGLIGEVEEAVVVEGLAFAGDEHHVGTDTELTIGGDVVPELVVEVADTGHDGDVEVGRGGVVVVHVFVTPGAADHVPEEVGL